MDCIYKKYLNKKCNCCQCGQYCIKQTKLDKLFDYAMISETQRKYIDLYVDEDGCDDNAFRQLSSIQNDIVRFVEEGKSVFINSYNCGNGKTSWALRLAQAYIFKIFPRSELKCKVLFINVPRFLMAIKDNISEKSEYVTYIKENVYDADIVIFDDIGNKVTTQYECDNLLSIIDTRIVNGKSNIYTSNISQEDMNKYLGERLTSRVVNYSYNIKLVGGDKRGFVNEIN